MSDSLQKELDASVGTLRDIDDTGVIQPHGAVVLVEPNWRAIFAVSANLARFLGLPPARALELTSRQLLGDAAIDALAAPLASRADFRPAMTLSPADRPGAQTRLHVAAHAIDRGIVLELEPVTPPFDDLPRAGVHWSARIASASTEREVLTALTQALCSLTGFESMAAFTLGGDGRARRVAQIGAPDIAGVPAACAAADGPEYAHRAGAPPCYLLADASADPVPLLYVGVAPDLSQASLHLAPALRQQCRSRHVRAALTLRLDEARQSLGLVVCQDRQPRHLAPALRDVLLQLAQVAAQRCALLRERLSSRRRQDLLGAMPRFGLSRPCRLPIEAMLAAGTVWMREFGACGLGLVYQGKCLGLGRRPADEQLQQVARHLDQHAPGRGWVSHTLDRSELDALLPRPDGTGSLLAVPLYGLAAPSGWLMLLRHRSGQSWSQPDLALATELGRLLSCHISVWRAQRRCRRLGERNARLRHLASTDPVTRVANRHRIEQILHEQLLVAERSGSPCSLLLLDIDRFKRINDGHGHEVGDRVLHRVAEQVQTRLRASDHLGRWGGEEFVIVAPGCDQPQALELAERLCAELAATSIAPVGRVTASFGVATWHSGDTPRRLVQRGDRAMYRAKQAGRACVRLQDDDA
ncbi:sensor domain-containing diguanylate cyclase [Billgrantia saliphila]|uniref:sensor domain-containing diguanylate cyclase n=1 Tax=Billgrantia saliphila TaxID=1848458 RepID=UPI000CE3B616|nr:sensor domain-containing diguanylate cyclase [Halomonas saliphila]